MLGGKSYSGASGVLMIMRTTIKRITMKAIGTNNPRAFSTISSNVSNSNDLRGGKRGQRAGTGSRVERELRVGVTKHAFVLPPVLVGVVHDAEADAELPEEGVGVGEVVGVDGELHGAV